HLVSSIYRRNHGNNTPYFLIPVVGVTGVMYLVLPFDLFLVMTAACTASFSVHVFLTSNTIPKKRGSHASLGSDASSSFTLSTICTRAPILQ
ncbi:MAG TPA: hypothetical protein VHS58_17815, partial [Acetobacteraceae bacterium]|nr:hypothetical protein [Acetobacteraceae bacterium]